MSECFPGEADHVGLAPACMRIAVRVAASASLALAGCGVVAAPCRIASAGLKAVPVVGHVAAAPTDVCADVIDP